MAERHWAGETIKSSIFNLFCHPFKAFHLYPCSSSAIVFLFLLMEGRGPHADYEKVALVLHDVLAYQATLAILTRDSRPASYYGRFLWQIGGLICSQWIVPILPD